MDSALDNADDPRRSRARLILGGLFLAWSVFLAFTGEIPATLMALVIGGLITTSYFARAGEADVRRGSFLIAGALLFCAFFMGELLVVLLPCGPGDAPCSGTETAGALALAGLTLTSGIAAIAEAWLAFKPSREREKWTRRFTVAALMMIALLYLLARVSTT